MHVYCYVKGAAIKNQCVNPSPGITVELGPGFSIWVYPFLPWKRSSNVIPHYFGHPHYFVPLQPQNHLAAPNGDDVNIEAIQKFSMRNS